MALGHSSFLLVFISNVRTVDAILMMIGEDRPPCIRDIFHAAGMHNTHYTVVAQISDETL